MTSLHTTRRSRLARLRSASAAVALALAACGPADAPSSQQAATPVPAQSPGLSTDSASIAVESSADSTITAAPVPADGLADNLPPVAIVTLDGSVWLESSAGELTRWKGVLDATASRVVAVQPDPVSGAATVAWVDARSATVEISHPIAADVWVAAVSPDGNLAALTSATAAATDDQSRVIIVNKERGVVAEWMLPGNLVPEAFADVYVGDGSGLPIGIFAIEYQTAELYRVRVIDPGTGTLAPPLDLRDKARSADSVMEAVGRTGVFDPVNRLLFTLYQGVGTPDHPGAAFVHTLGLVNGVYCLDLPAELELGSLDGMIAVSPTGRRLFVASPNGTVASFIISAIVDPTVTPVADEVVQLDGGESVAIAASDVETVVAFGAAESSTTVLRLEPATLAEVGRLQWPAAVEAMAIAGGDIIVGGDGLLARVAANGDVVAQVDLPDDVGPIVRLVVLAD
jgi:hypothetical protein